MNSTVAPSSLLVNKVSVPGYAEEILNRKDYLVLGLFLASGFSIIFMSSPRFLGTFIGNYTGITLYFAPFILVCLFTRCRFLLARSNRFPLLVISTLLVVSYLNVSFSDNPERSEQAMFDFVCTGLIPFVLSLVIFTKWKSVQIFDIFCAACLTLVVSVEAFAYLQRGDLSWSDIGVIVRNPIPTGTLVILLSSGPIWLIASRKCLQVVFGSVLLSSGACLIVLTMRKGSFLAASLMFASWAIVKRKKVALLVMPVIIILFMVILLQRENLSNIMDPNIPNNRSHLDRMEFYPFAFHIFQRHPFLGMGLRPFTQHDYLSSYVQTNQGLKHFKQVVRELQTFDSMYLTLLVEFGGVFFILYSCLIVWICSRFYYAYQTCSQGQKKRIYRVLPLFAFAIHSITYDSLMFEPINWLFHVQMGILASVDYS